MKLTSVFFGVKFHQNVGKKKIGAVTLPKATFHLNSKRIHQKPGFLNWVLPDLERLLLQLVKQQ
jgi:hypothetical protein